MLRSELPTTAFPIHFISEGAPDMWAEKTTRKIYALDRVDVNLLTVRDYTATENYKTDEDIAKENAVRVNAGTIDKWLKSYIEPALADIGPSKFLDGGVTPNPEYVGSTKSINNMLAYTNSEFNSLFLANPASFMRPILRWLRKTIKTNIADVRERKNLLDSDNVGAE